MIELEHTYLAKELPAGLAACECVEMVDLYIENGTAHPDLRVRKRGNRHEITRKSPVSEGDSSAQTEITIPLNAAEFASLQSVAARRVEKLRYLYPCQGMVAEVDVFQGALAGLVLIDFEFTNRDDQAAFVQPDFCLADVTQETFLAGGMLAGKRYEEIAADLARFGYTRLAGK